MTQKIAAILTAVFAAAIVLHAQETKRRPMTVDDSLNIVGAGGALLSPDGSFVFYSLSELDWAKNKRKTTYFKAPAEGGEAYQYIGEAGGSSFQFSPDGKFLSFTRPVDQKAQIFLMSTGGGEAVQLTNEKIIIGGFDPSPDGTRVLLTARSENRRNQGYLLEIEGILYLPPDYKPGKKVPLILNIHGGPAGSFSNRFSAIYHIYAGLGCASLCPNVRGSSGASDALLRGNMRDIGGGDYWDLMTGVDQVVKDGTADPNRLGLRGWSYGGILGGWTITQTNRFKAASIGAMVSDWASEYGPGFNHDVRLWYIGGTPWDNPAGYQEKSSLTYAKNVTTPTLILHGANDTTDTEPQSMNFFTYLKDMGKTVRYVKFPREPHGFGEPRHQRIRDIEEIAWMQKYVLGLDWKPWERQDEEKKDEKKMRASYLLSSFRPML